MSAASEDFVLRLMIAVPELAEDWDRYEGTYEKHGGPYGFLQEPNPEVFLTRAAFDLVCRSQLGGPGEAVTLQAAFDFMEAEHGADVQVDELIAESFVRYLPEVGGPSAATLDMLGPKLRAVRARKQREDESTRPAPIAFVYRMVRAVPALWFDLRADWEHHDFRERDLSPHGFMGWVVYAIVDQYAKGVMTTGEVPLDVRRLVDFLESEYGKDSDIDNVIAVSFVEQLPFPDEPGANIVTMLGPKLTAELRMQRGRPRGVGPS